MTSKLKWLIVSALFFASCSNEAAKPEEANPEVMEEKEEANQVATMAPDFFNYLSTQDTTFSTEKFEDAGSSPMDSTRPFPVDRKQLQPFTPYFIYNGDSSLAIDRFSYNYVPVRRKGKIMLEEGGPDTEIAVIDLGKNTRQRIFFSGPGRSVQETKWQDNQTIVLAGVEEVGAEAVKPVLWKINLADRNVQVFYYTDTLHANMIDYKRSKVPEEVNL